MNETFLNLPEEKRWRILQAAYEEFTDYQYKDASTNRIVKKAGIGKGMLFHYFGSKEKLYNYLIEFGYKHMKENQLKQVTFETRDFVERYRQLTQLKMRGYAEAPFILDFFGKLYLSDQMTENEMKKTIMKETLEFRKRLFDDLDYSLFRDDIPAAEIVEMIRLMVTGYENKITIDYKGKERFRIGDTDHVVKEFYQLLDRIKQVFYK